MQSLTIENWGLCPYGLAYERQLEYVQEVLAGARPDTLILLEHPPTYTVGLRKEAMRHLIWDEKERMRRGIALVQTNRGGDVTYHGPGQLVGYMICDLSKRGKDLHLYLRSLEKMLTDCVCDLGLNLSPREGKTGLWIRTRKIVAMGVAVKRWISYHGFAINVCNSLEPFEGIIPCGIPTDQGQVSSISQELGRLVNVDEMKAAIKRQAEGQFSS